MVTSRQPTEVTQGSSRPRVSPDGGLGGPGYVALSRAPPPRPRFPHLSGGGTVSVAKKGEPGEAPDASGISEGTTLMQGSW